MFLKVPSEGKGLGGLELILDITASLFGGGISECQELLEPQRVDSGRWGLGER